jgi:hypothetical protein
MWPPTIACREPKDAGFSPASTGGKAIADERPVLQQQRLCGDGADATRAQQLHEDHDEVDREDEEFAHGANGTINTGDCKTARRG